jgi:hypothetical protein
MSGVGRRCHKAVFSLLPLAYRAVFLLAGALGIGFVHPGIKEAYLAWRWGGACVVKGTGKAIIAG